jgi:hypothetical protein
MGVDLGNGREWFCLNWHGWEYAFDSAIEYGWEPMGTELKNFEGWEGGYFTNDYQVIIKEDATNMAKALRKAVDDGKEPFLLELADFINKKRIRIL